jgi:hypothetical protein
MLAVVLSLMALSVTPANAQQITKFGLSSARLLQKSSAIHLTFSVGCDVEPIMVGILSADYTLPARVEQRLGKTTVRTISGASVSSVCRSATTPSQ